MQRAIGGIEAELQERLAWFEAEGKLLEAQRLRMRTSYDLEMLAEVGVCSGIENYSRHIDGRHAGEPPHTLLDFFPKDYLLVIDESHQTVPQLHGQYEGDRSRKETLIEHGFRLPSAADNRPLRFEEFYERVNQCVFLSATPSPYEIQQSTQVVEQIVRPTGLVDPEVIVKPTKGQIDDLIAQIQDRTERGDRVLVTTLTKKMAEDLTDYLLEMGLRVRYLHSNIDTIQRIEILRDLRLGEFDVLVGHQPAAGGARPARGVPGRHPRRRQGGVPARRDLAHPDHRPGGPQRRRPGDHVRRPDDRLDAAGHLGDPPAAGRPAGVQRRARHRPADDPQGGHRHPGHARVPDGTGPRRCPARTGGAGAGTGPAATWPSCRTTSWPGSSPPSRRRCARPPRTFASSTRPGSATRSRISRGELKELSSSR